MEKTPNPEPKKNSESIFARLFPQRAASGWPSPPEPLNLEELREDLRIFGESEDLWGYYYKLHPDKNPMNKRPRK